MSFPKIGSHVTIISKHLYEKTLNSRKEFTIEICEDSEENRLNLVTRLENDITKLEVQNGKTEKLQEDLRRLVATNNIEIANKQKQLERMQAASCLPSLLELLPVCNICHAQFLTSPIMVSISKL